MTHKNQNGFVPMLILLIVVIGLVVWFAYKHVSSAHQKTIKNTVDSVQQNANPVN